MQNLGPLAHLLTAFIHLLYVFVTLCRCFVDRLVNLYMCRAALGNDGSTQRHEELYWFRPEPYVQSQRWFEFVFLGWMLWSSYNGVCKLRERGRSEVNESPNRVLRFCPNGMVAWLPLYIVRGPGYMRREGFSRPSGCEPERGRNK